MIISEVLGVVLKELKFRLPETVIVDSFQWVYAPALFKTEYKELKLDVDKYFMHLSNTTSKDSLYQLTVEMSSADATKELQLISAKILLSLQELSQLENSFIIHLGEPESFEWFVWFYHNQGQIIPLLNKMQKKKT